MQKKISIIFPTRVLDEKSEKFAKNFVKYFKKVEINLIIITKKIETKSKIKNSKIIIQKKKGFMNACFEAVNYVKDDYFTFLYDDDTFDKKIEKLYIKIFSNNFAMGYGKIDKIESSLNNKKILFRKYKAEKILNAYFGDKIEGIPFLPVSPICAIFEKKIISIWIKNILNFCNKNNFRTKFILELNIGGDLLLYLLQLIKLNDKKVLISYPNIVNFNIHPNSMSFRLGLNKLRIGYWLAKKSLIDLNKVKDKKLQKIIFSYLFLTGLYILLYNLFLNLIKKENYFKDFKDEIKSLIKNKNFNFGFYLILKIIVKKIT